MRFGEHGAWNRVHWTQQVIFLSVCGPHPGFHGTQIVKRWPQLHPWFPGKPVRGLPLRQPMGSPEHSTDPYLHAYRVTGTA